MTAPLHPAVTGIRIQLGNELVTVSRDVVLALHAIDRVMGLGPTRPRAVAWRRPGERWRRM